jgi:hypothetical protein
MATEGTTNITLSRPLEIDGAKVATLTMREPLVADKLTASKRKGSEEEQQVAMIADLCGVTPGDIERLPIRDYMKLVDALQDFIS